MRIARRPAMENQTLLSDLHEAIDRLADAVDDQPAVAAALRRFATRLPEAERSERSETRLPQNPSAIRPLLWEALADGLIDGHQFDVAMVTRARAAQVIAAHDGAGPRSRGR